MSNRDKQSDQEIIEGFRGIGETFYYQGHEMVVTSHKSGLYDPEGGEPSPRLEAKFIDPKGPAKGMSFGAYNIPSLIEENS